MSDDLKPMTREQQDAALSRVFEKVAAFKSPTLLRVSCAVLRAAMECNGTGLFPDDPRLAATVESLRGDDKNVVGNSYRWLGKVGLIVRGQARRKSTTPASNGREICAWHCANHQLARTFLARNEKNHQPAQKELF